MSVSAPTGGERMKRLTCTTAAVVATLTASRLGATTASAGETLVVDDDGIQCGAEAYTTITAALDSALDGDTIRVCPGRYGGRIHVSKSVRIVGPLTPITTDDCLQTSTELPDADL